MRFGIPTAELPEVFAALVFFIGFYGLITGRSAIKSIIFIGIMEIAVIIFFLSLGFRSGIVPPIGLNLENTADPLPQALMITDIIIGLAATAVSLTMLISLCRQSKTMDWDNIQKNNME